MVVALHAKGLGEEGMGLVPTWNVINAELFNAFLVPPVVAEVDQVEVRHHTCLPLVFCFGFVSKWTCDVFQTPQRIPKRKSSQRISGVHSSRHSEAFYTSPHSVSLRRVWPSPVRRSGSMGHSCPSLSGVPLVETKSRSDFSEFLLMRPFHFNRNFILLLRLR